MNNFEIVCSNEHTEYEQWIFLTSLFTGKYDRDQIEVLFKQDDDFQRKISRSEVEEILFACEKTTGKFLCTRFILLLIAGFAISAIVLLITAIYLTMKKAERLTIIYTYVIAVTIGVFCNLLLFLIYMLISNIYEKQINLHLGQRKIADVYEKRNLFWKANGSRLILNNIYKRKCDQTCKSCKLNIKHEENKEHLLN